MPFIDLKRITQPLKHQVFADWEKRFEACEFVGGPAVTALENDLMKALSVNHVVACANGTDALILALQAMGVKPGQKVALPNLTFWATYEAIVQIGAVPVLVDIDRDDLQMSFDEFAKAHEKYRFEAAILVHLYGWCSTQLARFRTFCQERKIGLLEDGAQCYGVTPGEESIFAGAAIATLSFYPAKVFGGIMDGGAIVTKDAKLAETCRRLANHGRAEHYSYSHVGWNSRMSGLQASFLSKLLPHVPQHIESRNAGLKYYVETCEQVGNVRVYLPPKNVTGNGYLSVLTVDGKSGEELAQELKARGIGFGRTYPETMDMQPPAREALRASDLKVSREFSKNVINLPLFAGITADELKRSVSAFMEII